MTDILLNIKNIQIGYQAIPLITNFNLVCRKGDILTIVGTNGTGKSCLFRTIMGIIPCLEGELFFCDQDITNTTLNQRRLLGISLCPEGRLIFPNLTVSENLKTGMAINGLFYKKDKERIDETFSKFPKLYERRNQLGGTLSGGEQQLLALARSIILKPKLLLLDEPTLGISRLILDDVIKVILNLSNMGILILLTDQNEDKFKDISSCVITLKNDLQLKLQK